VVLNFLTRDPSVFAIPKSSNPEHTRENAGAAGWDLAAAEIAAIDRESPAPKRDVPLGMI
jgi:diketogulonate reductase-like aldo/keto reductase